MDKKRAVLVVDDDPDLRKMLCTVLASEGYTVEAAADGAEALDLLHRHDPPDVLLLDIMMPRMDGQSFVQRIAGDPALARIPIAILSGDGRVCRQPWPPPVSACLVKPVELDELLTLVARLAA